MENIEDKKWEQAVKMAKSLDDDDEKDESDIITVRSKDGKEYPILRKTLQQSEFMKAAFSTDKATTIDLPIWSASLDCIIAFWNLTYKPLPVPIPSPIPKKTKFEDLVSPEEKALVNREYDKGTDHFSNILSDVHYMQIKYVYDKSSNVWQNRLEEILCARYSETIRQNPLSTIRAALHDSHAKVTPLSLLPSQSKTIKKTSSSASRTKDMDKKSSTSSAPSFSKKLVERHKTPLCEEKKKTKACDSDSDSENVPLDRQSKKKKTVKRKKYDSDSDDNRMIKASESDSEKDGDHHIKPKKTKQYKKTKHKGSDTD